MWTYVHCVNKFAHISPFSQHCLIKLSWFLLVCFYNCFLHQNSCHILVLSLLWINWFSCPAIVSNSFVLFNWSRSQFTLSRITHYIGYTGTWHFRQNFLSTAIFIKIAKYSLLPTWTDSPHSTSINTQVQGTPTTRHGLSWSKIFLKIAWLVSCQHSPNFTLFPPTHSNTPHTGPPSPPTVLTWLTSRRSVQVVLRMCGNKWTLYTTRAYIKLPRKLYMHYLVLINLFYLCTTFTISCYFLVLWAQIFDNSLICSWHFGYARTIPI